MDAISRTASDSEGTEEKSVRDSSENEETTEDSSETETEAEEDSVYSWEGGSEEEETDEDSPESVTETDGDGKSSVDRISSLPDSVVQRILSFLPSTKQAVQSGILSNRWRNQWTRVPNLVFSPEFRSANKYLRFIDNTLVLHDCSNLQKFQLEYDPKSKQDPQFFPKIRFALRKGVEELILLCYCDEESYLLPKFLFDNASLVRLEIENCYFMPDWRVNWESLKSLKMDCSSMSGNSNWIGNVVSGCRLLESLELWSGTLGDQEVAIVSKSLKILILKDVKLPSDAKILCPNLVVLHVVEMVCWNSTFSDQMIRDVLSRSLFLSSFKLVTYHGYDQLVIASNSVKTLHLELIETKLVEISCPNLEKLDLIGLESEKFEVVNLPSSVSATLYFLWCGEYLAQQILEQLQHVEKITFDGCFTTMVSDILVDGYLSLPILKSKSLTLKAGSCFALDIPGIAYALRSPNLEKLVIDLKSHQFTTCKVLRDTIKSREQYWNSQEAALFGCLVSNLKTVEIIGLSERDEERKLVANFVEFLLKNAKVLDKMLAY